jgi:hypothetical protein
MTRLVLLFVLAVTAVQARSDVLPATVRAQAVRRSSAIAVDGHLDEASWAAAPKQTGFVQRFPKDGGKVQNETTFAVLYDDAAIYVGVWADDAEPDRIRHLLTRRDVDAPADAISIGIDSYHDRRTAYMFQLNAAGVQRDLLVFDDQGSDDTWDAVWTGASAVHDHGWTAEFRIPLNQLRFAGGESQQWGFQVLRNVGRTQEQSAWSPWPRSGPQIVSKFGVLEGIEHLAPSTRLELLPYVLGGIQVSPIEADDPLNDRIGARRNIGLDLKYGLGPAFTISATVNPDFGQVEADPSQVNLGPSELFFAEKRPFFLEGMDLFKLPTGSSDDSVESPFYSRRIGAAPPAPAGDVQYLKQPQSTGIYGAVKLTGKTSDGWSLGALDAVTGEEHAVVVDSTGSRSTPLVAPLTNFAVARIKRDFREGKTALGASATAVDRALSGTPLEMVLHDHAYTGGAQVQHRWGDDAWAANLHVIGSWIHGSEQAIAATQTANTHLFQRPDATNVTFDPSRTSMSGLDTTWLVGRIGDTKHWRVGTGGNVRTPGFEINDAGFQTESDRIVPFAWSQYRVDEPSDNILNWQTRLDLFAVSTFEPRLLVYGLDWTATMQLPSYWQLGAASHVGRNRWDPVALRGGPALRTDPAASGSLSMTTDNRKRLWFNVNLDGKHNWTTELTGWDARADMTIQARSNIDITVGAEWSERDDPLQYVDQPDDGAGVRHYILARIRQRVASMVFRMNWTFSPRLSLQAYAQPFLAVGRYSEYKDVEAPHADRYTDRFYVLGDSDYSVMDGTVSVDHGGLYSFAKPDFDFRELRSTVVFRWEYRPGSSIFAIWSHGRTSTTDEARFHLAHDLGELARAESENLVMVKANYWIGL